LKEEYKIVYDSIRELSKYKMLEDMHIFEEEKLKKQITLAYQEKREADTYVITFLEKNSALLDDLKAMKDVIAEEQSKKVVLQRTNLIKSAA
jgi:hypothetical protein